VCATAQGSVVAFARLGAGLLAIPTPLLMDISVQGMYAVLALVVAVGMLIGLVAFRRRRSVFEAETESTEAPRAFAGAGVSSQQLQTRSET
jgi:uncharacterized membrane protein YfcA